MRKASEDYNKLRAYVSDKPHGFLLEYQIVQKETGVFMDSKGRAKLRNAIIKSEREYYPIANVGYELLAITNAGDIQRRRNRHLRNTVTTTVRCTVTIKKTFEGILPESDQVLIDGTSQFLKVILEKSGTLETKTEVQKLNMPSIPKIVIPD